MQKAVRLEVHMPQGRRVGDFSHPPCVGFHVVRGRITERSSWFLLELTGTARRIQEAVRAFRDRGVSVRFAP
jgi:hypothetical protein